MCVHASACLNAHVFTVRCIHFPLDTNFKFSEVEFSSIEDIPLSLLKSISKCLKHKQEVCRKCYYGDRKLSSKQSKAGSKVQVCSISKHRWKNPVFVIPGCPLCDNLPCFQPGEHVAILPLPAVVNLKMCNRRNHHKCFATCMEVNSRVAHAVEELVVWIVESELEGGFLRHTHTHAHTHAHTHTHTHTHCTYHHACVCDWTANFKH